MDKITDMNYDILRAAEVIKGLYTIGFSDTASRLIRYGGFLLCEREKENQGKKLPCLTVVK